LYSNYTSKARRKIDILLHKRSREKLLSVGRQGSREERGKKRKTCTGRGRDADVSKVAHG